MKLLVVSILLVVCVGYSQGIQERQLKAIVKQTEDEEDRADRRAPKKRTRKLHQASRARFAMTPTSSLTELTERQARVLEMATGKAIRSGASMGEIKRMGPKVSLGKRKRELMDCLEPEEAQAPTGGRKSWCLQASIDTPYRTQQGYCNNRVVGKELQGMANQRQIRTLPANYEDGVGTKPREHTANGKGKLPSARKVSTTCFRNKKSLSKELNSMFQWGQYIAHDITLTPISQASIYGGGALSCDACNSRTTESPNCFPIQIPKDDPHFGKAGNCMPFVRSSNAQSRLGTREISNAISAYIDASSVYSADFTVNRLRESGPNSGGRLKVQANGLMPTDPSNAGCQSAGQCFLAGDPRNSITMGLASMHTMWVYEHNRIAKELARMNPTWETNEIFQEARKIVGALHQQITYNEFLPSVLGSTIMKKFKLNLNKRRGFTNFYDDKCDAGISVEFSTAGLRFGHSLLNAHFKQGTSSKSWNLNGNFFAPAHLYASPKQNWRNIMLGFQHQKCENGDRNFDAVLQHRLFASKEDPLSGVDLIALNIQRGRDHGVQFYVNYRKHYGLSVPRNWNELNRIMARGAMADLRKVYKSVADIELYPGIISEKTMKNALVGELSAHIIGDQFSRLKKCDRFWFESKSVPSDYPERDRADQLKAIRKVTLRDVMCGVIAEIGGAAGEYCKGSSRGPVHRQPPNKGKGGRRPPARPPVHHRQPGRGKGRGGRRGKGRRGKRAASKAAAPLDVEPWKEGRVRQSRRGRKGGRAGGRRLNKHNRSNPKCTVQRSHRS